MSDTKNRLFDLCEFVHALGFAEMLQNELSSLHEDLLNSGYEDAVEAMVKELAYRFGGDSGRAERFLKGGDVCGMQEPEEEPDLITEAYFEGMTDAYDYAACFVLWACREYKVKAPDRICASGAVYERFMKEPYGLRFRPYQP